MLPYDYECAKCHQMFTEDEVITLDIVWGGYDNVCDDCFCKARETAQKDNYSPYKDFQHLLD